jgi:hypothetical protein
MAISGKKKKKSWKSAQILQNYWQFQKTIPKNVASFLEIFQKVPLTMLHVILLFFSKMPTFATEKITEYHIIKGEYII